MGYQKKKLTFISIRREDFINFLLTGRTTVFPAEEVGEISHLSIKGIRKYEVTGKYFSLETTVTFKGKTFPAKMTGRVSSHYTGGKIEFRENTDNFE